MTVAYADLLRLGYESGQMDPSSGSLDCAGVVRCILVRMGYPAEMMPMCGREIVKAMLGASEVVSASGTGWKLLGSGEESAKLARLVGDVVLSKTDEGLHVSVTVKSPPHGRALSSARGIGVYTIPNGLIQNVLSAWRPYRP